MNIEYYNELLSEAVRTFILKGVGVFCVVIVMCLIGWLMHKKQGLPFKFTTKRILMLALAFVLSCLVAGYDSIPASKDIKAEDYVKVHGTYTRYSEGISYRNFMIHGYVYMDPDDSEERINMILATRNYTTEYFPLGEHKGTIIYARRSGIALEFIPDP